MKTPFLRFTLPLTFKEKIGIYCSKFNVEDLNFSNIYCVIILKESEETMIDNNNRLDIAQEYFNKAYKYQIEGKIEEAIDYYKMSIDLFPTAEAHTYLGWAYGIQGKYEDAIDECYVAIDIDENYGNPYNDIGTYLINLKRYEEAIIWLEKAINAPRYSARHFPYYNLGRIYEKKGEWFRAMDYYKEALELYPRYEAAKKAIIRLTTLMN